MWLKILHYCGRYTPHYLNLNVGQTIFIIVSVTPDISYAVGLNHPFLSRAIIVATTLYTALMVIATIIDQIWLRFS